MELEVVLEMRDGVRVRVRIWGQVSSFDSESGLGFELGARVTVRVGVRVES